MKLKIRGLVFSGFAAAVFAQSASAVVPPSQMVAAPEGYSGTLNEYKTELKKTVTSQDYVDENFQEREKTGLNYNSGTLEFEEKAVYVPWNYGQGGINKEWVKLDSRKQLASTSGGTQDTEYVQIVHAGKGVDQHYVELNTASITVDSGTGNNGADKIEAAGQDGATALEKGRLTTAKAVYDFVTDAIADAGDEYQPKVDTTGLKVGVRTGAGTQADPYDSTWYSIAAGRRVYNGDVPSEVTTPGYVTFDTYVDSNNPSNSNVAVDLDRGMVLEGSGGAEDITLASAGDKLPTGYAVAKYSVPMNWTERGTEGSFAVANQKLVTDANGNVILADDDNGLPSEDDMPSECRTANGGKICALVAYYDATLNNNQGGVKYEWTIMAPTGA